MPRPRRLPPRPVDPLITALREARRARGISQGVLAAAIGTTQTVLSAWEVGINPPDLPVLRRWSAHLGFEVKLAGVVEEAADAVYGRGWDDCAAAVAAAVKRAGA